MKKVIETTYSSNVDMTFILEYVYNDNNTCISTEVKGFYHGEPTEENTKTFYNKLKAEYI